MIIVGSPQIKTSDIRSLIEVYKSGWWINGAKTKELTQEFMKYIGCRYAVPVGSGTFALHLALDVLGLGPGDEVITTPFTFPATVHAIEYVGAKPVFVDIDNQYYNMDPRQIESKISSKTKAILPIHIAGQACDMDQIRAIAAKHHLYVVEDAAHAIESTWKNQKIGNISDMSCFSFDVTKNVAGGMGGMIATNRKDFFDKLTLYSHFGFSQSDNFQPYDTLYPGYKYDMSEFSAALALCSLKRVEKNLKTRQKYFKLYSQKLAHLPQLILPKTDLDSRHAYHLYMVLLNLEQLKCTRTEFMKYLYDLGVGTRIRFVAVHLHTYYRNKYEYRKGDYPVTEFVSDRVICLPLSARLRLRDVNTIINSVTQTVNHFKK